MTLRSSSLGGAECQLASIASGLAVLSLLHQSGVKQACHRIDFGQTVALRAHGCVNCGLRVFRCGGCRGGICIVCHSGLSSFVGLGGGCRRCICSSGSRCSRFSHRNVVGQLYARHQAQGVTICVDGLTVCACGDCNGFSIIQQFVGKALFYGLFACHIGSVGHHVQQHSFRHPSLALVDADLRLVPRIVGIGSLAQFICVVCAKNKTPAFVNHHEAGRIYADGIAGAHDKAAATHCYTVHDTDQLGAFGRQLPEPIVNQDGNACIAAQTVHADGDL